MAERPLLECQWGQKFNLVAKLPYCFGAHIYICSLVTGRRADLLGDRSTGESSGTLTSGAEIRNKWSYNSTPPPLHSFEGDSFTFTLYF